MYVCCVIHEGEAHHGFVPQVGKLQHRRYDCICSLSLSHMQ